MEKSLTQQVISQHVRAEQIIGNVQDQLNIAVNATFQGSDASSLSMRPKGQTDSRLKVDKQSSDGTLFARDSQLELTKLSLQKVLTEKQAEMRRIFNQPLVQRNQDSSMFSMFQKNSRGDVDKDNNQEDYRDDHGEFCEEINDEVGIECESPIIQIQKFRDWRQFFDPEELDRAYEQSIAYSNPQNPHNLQRFVVKEKFELRVDQEKYSDNEGSDDDASDDNLQEVDLYKVVYLQKDKAIEEAMRQTTHAYNNFIQEVKILIKKKNPAEDPMRPENVKNSDLSGRTNEELKETHKNEKPDEPYNFTLRPPPNYAPLQLTGVHIENPRSQITGLGQNQQQENQRLLKPGISLQAKSLMLKNSSRHPTEESLLNVQVAKIYRIDDGTKKQLPSKVVTKFSKQKKNKEAVQIQQALAAPIAPLQSVTGLQILLSGNNKEIQIGGRDFLSKDGKSMKDLEGILTSSKLTLPIQSKKLGQGQSHQIQIASPEPPPQQVSLIISSEEESSTQILPLKDTQNAGQKAEPTEKILVDDSSTTFIKNLKLESSFNVNKRQAYTLQVQNGLQQDIGFRIKHIQLQKEFNETLKTSSIDPKTHQQIPLQQFVLQTPSRTPGREEYADGPSSKRSHPREQETGKLHKGSQLFTAGIVASKVQLNPITETRESLRKSKNRGISLKKQGNQQTPISKTEKRFSQVKGSVLLAQEEFLPLSTPIRKQAVTQNVHAGSKKMKHRKIESFEKAQISLANESLPKQNQVSAKRLPKNSKNAKSKNLPKNSIEEKNFAQQKQAYGSKGKQSLMTSLQHEASSSTALEKVDNSIAEHVQDHFSTIRIVDHHNASQHIQKVSQYNSFEYQRPSTMVNNQSEASEANREVRKHGVQRNSIQSVSGGSGQSEAEIFNMNVVTKGNFKRRQTATPSHDNGDLMHLNPQQEIVISRLSSNQSDSLLTKMKIRNKKLELDSKQRRVVVGRDQNRFARNESKNSLTKERPKSRLNVQSQQRKSLKKVSLFQVDADGEGEPQINPYQIPRFIAKSDSDEKQDSTPKTIEKVDTKISAPRRGDHFQKYLVMNMHAVQNDMVKEQYARQLIENAHQQNPRGFIEVHKDNHNFISPTKSVNNVHEGGGDHSWQRQLEMNNLPQSADGLTQSLDLKFFTKKSNIEIVISTNKQKNQPLIDQNELERPPKNFFSDVDQLKKNFANFNEKLNQQGHEYQIQPSRSNHTKQPVESSFNFVKGSLPMIAKTSIEDTRASIETQAKLSSIRQTLMTGKQSMVYNMSRDQLQNDAGVPSSEKSLGNINILKVGNQSSLSPDRQSLNQLKLQNKIAQKGKNLHGSQLYFADSLHGQRLKLKSLLQNETPQLNQNQMSPGKLQSIQRTVQEVTQYERLPKLTSGSIPQVVMIDNKHTNEMGSDKHQVFVKPFINPNSQRQSNDTSPTVNKMILNLRRNQR